MAVDPNLTDDQKKGLKRNPSFWSRVNNKLNEWAAPLAPKHLDHMAGVAPPRVPAMPSSVQHAAERFVGAETPNDSSEPSPPEPAPSAAPESAPAGPMELGLKRLPQGFQRLRDASGSGAQIYVAKDKNGNPIFSDKYGLSDYSPSELQANPHYETTAEGPSLGRVVGHRPNSHYAYADNSLQRKGINTRQALMSASPDELRSDLATLSTTTAATPEEDLSNRMLGMRINSRLQGLKRGAAASVSTKGMTPYQQAQIARGLRNDARSAANTRADNARADAKEERQAAADFRAALEKAKPGEQAALVSRNLPRGLSREQFDQFLNTPKGQAVIGGLRKVLMQGASNATWWPEFGDRAALKNGTVGLADIALDPKTGSFEGFYNDGGNEYPRQGGWFNKNNYNEKMLRSVPNKYWQWLRSYYRALQAPATAPNQS